MESIMSSMAMLIDINYCLMGRMVLSYIHYIQDIAQVIFAIM